jgi:hypothetical protein
MIIKMSTIIGYVSDWLLIGGASVFSVTYLLIISDKIEEKRAARWCGVSLSLMIGGTITLIISTFI